MSLHVIQRKQYGCVQMLLVQIGMALYVIVVFLAQNGDGSITPKVLKVQKVAEANQTRLAAASDSALDQAEHALLGFGTGTASTVEAQIIALLAAPQAGTALAPVVTTIDIADGNLFPYKTADIHSLGSKPRAPSVIA